MCSKMPCKCRCIFWTIFLQKVSKFHFSPNHTELYQFKYLWFSDILVFHISKWPIITQIRFALSLTLPFRININEQLFILAIFSSLHIFIRVCMSMNVSDFFSLSSVVSAVTFHIYLFQHVYWKGKSRQYWGTRRLNMILLIV